MNNWKRNISFFLAGQSVSLFGSTLVHYAVQWHITLESQSGVAMMLLALSAAVPMFVISPIAGVLADRYDKKRIINLADAAIAAVTLVMALLFSMGIEHIALLLICLAMRGFGQGIQTPTVGSLLPELVPRQHLTRVNGVSSSIQSIAMFASPIAGGALLYVAPIQVILFIDVATAAAGITLLLFFVKIPKASSPDLAPVRQNAFGDIREGLRYIKTNPFIKRLLTICLCYNLLISPAAVLTPLQVVRDFGEEPWRLIAVELAFFIGMSLGGLLMGVWGGFRNKSHTMSLATALSGASIAALGLLQNFYCYLAAMLICGVFLSIFNAPMTAVLQTKVEPRYLGRVFSVMTMIASIAMPAGMFVWGPLGDMVEIDLLMMVSGAGIFAVGWPFVGSKPLREAGLPAAADKQGA